MSPQQAAENRADSKMFGWKTYEGTPCKHGHTTRYTTNCQCVECIKNWNRNDVLSGQRALRKLKNKTRLVEEMGGKCTRCEQVVSLEQFEFHHVNPAEKSFKLSDRMANSYESLKVEANKCELVCRTCHNAIHERKF